MKLRTGRKNPRTLYLQLGDVPSDDDPCVAFMVDPDTASVIAGGLTSPWHLEEPRLAAEGRGYR